MIRSTNDQIAAKNVIHPLSDRCDDDRQRLP